MNEVYSLKNGDMLKVTGHMYTFDTMSESYGHGTENSITIGTILIYIDRSMLDDRLWINTDKGYLLIYKNLNNLEVMGITGNAGNSSTDGPLTSNSDPIYDNNDVILDGSGYQPNLNTYLSYQNKIVSDSEFVKIKNVAGVFGLPYQFLPNADLRLSGDQKTENIGYEYAEKIIERIPLLFLAPGKANFMTKYSKETKKTALEYVANVFTGNAVGSLEDLLDSDGRYFTFEYDMTKYYKYVNPMCRIAARFLELQDVVVNGTKLDRMNWETYTKSGISSISDLGFYSAVPFYIDTDTSISENLSNSTTQSMIASTVNSISDMSRELQFLLGPNNKINGMDALSDPDVSSSLENVRDMIGRLLGSGNFMSTLAGHLTTVASGGKLVFPEIWSDSTFSRSYSCELKFIAPDPSKLSVYLNVLVPLFHLLGLVAPQSEKNNPNGYINPFLVRAVYKGFFNIDMGIITNMSITKGADCQWTPEGIPTSITVSIDIKDLYSALSITSTESTDWSFDTLNNTALMDYIANLCGINIFKPEIGRLIDMWFVNNVANRIEDLFQVDIWGGIQDRVQNLIMSIYR